MSIHVKYEAAIVEIGIIVVRDIYRVVHGSK